MKLVALAALVLAVAASAPAAGARTSCSAGVKTVNGLTERTFCGPAKATVHFGAKTFSFKGGNCAKSGPYYAVNVGTVVLGITTKPKPNYFGLDIGKPGTDVLALDYGGKAYLVLGTTLKVTRSGSHGTFSGTGFGGSPKVTGSFSC